MLVSTILSSFPPRKTKFIECTRQQPLFQKWFLWDSEESFTGFGFACFKTVDNTMFDERYSKELYGLHGAGEVLVAKVSRTPHRLLDQR